ncbi:transmembrane E3 ubiquitin-protein ligase FLY2-like [Apium graveolens]|uniref:transmembrane E3 ubiquitin-protein ligase FLY2-like n=1 Tax=Apium graveolens TaxID=4045 RepID=UPI003D7BED04
MDSVITNLHFTTVLIRVFLSLSVVLVLFAPLATAVQSIRNTTHSTDDQWQPTSPFDWNITGKYAGSWRLMNPTESNPIIRKSSGDSVLELISTPTTSKGVYHVKGMVIFYKVFEDEHKVWGATIKIEGDYIWPLRLLRAVAYTEKAGESGYKDDYNISNPHYSFGLLTSQDFQEFQWVKIWNRKLSPVIDMEKHCNITVRARISRVPSMQSNEDGSSYHIEAALVRFLMDDNGDCLPPMQLNATSVNTEMFFDKAFNYNLMVTFISLLQVLLLIQQRKHSNTQSGAVKVSSFTIGQQAIMDAYLCLLHLTAGITVEQLYNAFSTAAFFKFVVFSFCELRFFLHIWKANRSTNYIQSVEARRELSVLCINFCGILLGVILCTYEFPKFLPVITLVVHSYWIPQIATNVFRDPRKPLQPSYIIGMSVTRLAIPLYIFGCPRNFMQFKPDRSWCIYLVGFAGLQANIFLLQHYLGCRFFIFWQILMQMFPLKYNYHKRPDQDVNHASDCVICMTPIDFTQHPDFCMVTPCEHVFHSHCLLKWMDIKMDCPTCRRRLPPV